MSFNSIKGTYDKNLCQLIVSVAIESNNPLCYSCKILFVSEANTLDIIFSTDGSISKNLCLVSCGPKDITLGVKVDNQNDPVECIVAYLAENNSVLFQKNYEITQETIESTVSAMDTSGNSSLEPEPDAIPDPTLEEIQSSEVGLINLSEERPLWSDSLLNAGNTVKDTICNAEFDISESLSIQNCESHQNPDIAMLPSGHAVIAFEDRDPTGLTKIVLQVFNTSVQNKIKYHRSLSRGRFINDPTTKVCTFEIYDDLGVSLYQNCSLGFLNGPMPGKIVSLSTFQRIEIDGVFSKFTATFTPSNIVPIFNDANDNFDVSWFLIDLSDSTLPSESTLSSIIDLGYHLDDTGIPLKVANPSVSTITNSRSIGGELYIYVTYQAFENSVWNIYLKQIRISEETESLPVYNDPFNFNEKSGIDVPVIFVNYENIIYTLKEVERVTNSYVVGRFYVYSQMTLQSGQDDPDIFQISNCENPERSTYTPMFGSTSSLDNTKAIVEVFFDLTSTDCQNNDPGWNSSFIGMDFTGSIPPVSSTFNINGSCSQIYTGPDIDSWCVFQPSCFQLYVLNTNQCDLEYVTIPASSDILLYFTASELYLLQSEETTVTRVEYEISTKLASHISDNEDFSDDYLIVYERDTQGFTPTYFKKAKVLITYSGDLLDLWNQDKSFFNFTCEGINPTDSLKGLSNFPFELYSTSIYGIDSVHLLGIYSNWVYFLNSEQPEIQYPFVGYLASQQSENIFIASNAIRPKLKTSSRNDLFISYESYSSGLSKIHITGTGDFAKSSILGAVGDRVTKFYTTQNFQFNHVIELDKLHQLCDIVIDKNDVVHISWQTNMNGPWEIYYANGYSFFDPVRITNANHRSSYPKIDVDDFGNVFIVYHDNRFGIYEILMSYKKSQRILPLLQQNSYLASIASGYIHNTNRLVFDVMVPMPKSASISRGFYGTKTTADIGNVENALFLIDETTGQAECKLNTDPYQICSLATFSNGDLYGVTCDGDLLKINIDFDEYVSIENIGNLPISRTILFGMDDSFENTVSIQWLSSDPVRISSTKYRFHGSVQPVDYSVSSPCNVIIEYQFNNSAWSQTKPTITQNGKLSVRAINAPTSLSFAHFQLVASSPISLAATPQIYPYDPNYGIEPNWNINWSMPSFVQFASGNNSKVNIYYKFSTSVNTISDPGVASPLNSDGFVTSENTLDLKSVSLPQGNIVTVRAMAVFNPDNNTGWQTDKTLIFINPSIQSNKPTISYPTGNFPPPNKVTISNNNKPFYYKTGTAESNPYLFLSNTCYNGWTFSTTSVIITLSPFLNNFVAAVGKESDKYYSPLVSAFYTWNGENGPSFNPVDVEWCDDSRQIEISTLTGHPIYYTKSEHVDTPGSEPGDPSASSSLYAGPISLTSTYTRFKAITINEVTGAQSVVTNQDYLHTCCQPELNPTGSSYSFYDSLDIVVTCSTKDAIVRYSIDSMAFAVKDWNNPLNDFGTDIVPASGESVSSIITIDSNTTLTILSYMPDHSRANSQMLIANYTQSNTVPTPSFSPYNRIVTNSSGFLVYEYGFIDSVDITINCSDSLATIRYTTDGTYPTSSSPIYSLPITISQDTLITARAFRTGKTASIGSFGDYTKIGTNYDATIKDAAADALDRLWVIFLENNPDISGNEISISLINQLNATEIVNTGPIFTNVDSDSEAGLAINTVTNEFFITIKKDGGYCLYKSIYPTVTPLSSVFSFTLINSNLSQSIVKMSFDTSENLFGYDPYNNLYSIDTVTGSVSLANGIFAIDSCNPITITSGLSLAILASPISPSVDYDLYHIIIEFYDNIKLIGNPYLIIDSRLNLEAFVGEEPYFSTADGVYLKPGELRELIFNAAQTRPGSDNLSYPYPFDTNKTYFPKLKLIKISTGEIIELSEVQSVSFSCNKCNKYATNSTDLTGCSYSCELQNLSDINQWYFLKTVLYNGSDPNKDFLHEYSTNNSSNQAYFQVNNRSLSDEEIVSGIMIPPGHIYLVQVYPGLDPDTDIVCGVEYNAIFHYSTDQSVWSEVSSQSGLFFCECSSSIFNDPMQHVDSISRWISSANGMTDTKISDTTENELKPCVKRRSDDRMIILWESDKSPESTIIGGSFKINDSDYERSSGSMYRFDYDFDVDGLNVRFGLDIYDRLFMIYEKLHLVDIDSKEKNTQLPYSTLSYKICDLTDRTESISEKCDYTKLNNEITTSDPFIFEQLVKKIYLKKENVKYFTYNTSGRVVPIVDDCRITLCIFGTPEVTAFRVRNENESFYHNWCPWNPVLGDYYLEYDWTLSPGSGLKDICIQVVTYSGINSEFCLPVIADYATVLYSVNLYDDSQYTNTLPLYNGFFVAATKGILNENNEEIRDIYVEIVPAVKIDKNSITFDVLFQGDESMYDLPANRLTERSDKSIFRGKITIKKDRLRNKSDGLAQIVPYFGTVCEISHNTNLLDSTEKDQYNILSTIDQRESQDVSLDQYRTRSGSIGVPIITRPTNEDPFMIFGNPDYFEQRPN